MAATVDDASAELAFQIRDLDGVSTYTAPIHFRLVQR
jgi:hypothetical protein